MMTGKSIFTISLDFELHWGGFEKWPITAYSSCFENTRVVISKILKEFDRTKVHGTWATVGLLLNENRQEVVSNIPVELPSYIDTKLSAYNFIRQEGIGDDEMTDPFHYAGSIVKSILYTPNQELASHSYSHYYCNEPGQTPSQFLADAKSWNKTAAKYNVKAESIVFPRNQFNKNYLKICNEVGIAVVRTNPTDWWWKIDSTAGESRWKRFNRGLDAYFDVGGKTSYSLNEVKKIEGVYLLPASRLLRPYNPKELLLNSMKIHRIKKEMTRAAKSNECYHLWWHPHNFGNFTEQNMEGLTVLLNHYQYLHKQFGMKSLNMAGIARELNEINE